MKAYLSNGPFDDSGLERVVLLSCLRGDFEVAVASPLAMVVAFGKTFVVVTVAPSAAAAARAAAAAASVSALTGTGG